MFDTQAYSLTVQPLASTFNFYTSTAGNDLWTGTAPAFVSGNIGPFRTIGKGCQALSPGQSLGVRAGSYAEILTNQHFPNSGTSWNNKIRVANYNGEVVTLQPTSGQSVIALGGGTTTKQYIEIDGLNLNALQTGSGFGFVSPAHHIRLKNCTITSPNIANWSNNQAYADFCEYYNLVNTGGGSGTCGTQCSSYSIYIAADNCILDGFDFSDMSGGGVHVYRSGGSHNNVIRNGRVHHLSRSGTGIFFGVVLNGNNNLVENVLVDHCSYLSSPSDMAFQIYTGSGNKIYNCTAADNNAWGFGAQGPGSTGSATNTQFRNCLSWNNARGDRFNNATGTIETDNSWQDIPGQNPLFVNASAGNYHIQSGSPAGNKGNRPSPVIVNGVTYAFDRDRDGISRPTICDLGLYEIV